MVVTSFEVRSVSTYATAAFEIKTCPNAPITLDYSID
jgi:hypothetical protein